MPNTTLTSHPFWNALQARTDLAPYGTNALLLFAVQLKFDIDDIATTAASAITDGGADEKADLVLIDGEFGYAVVAQAYTCQDVSQGQTAPSNKASDLNTAASWLLSRPLPELPAGLRASARELREGIQGGTIKSVYFWYVHNLNESQNVRNELTTVEHTSNNAIKQNFPNASDLQLQALEVGIQTLDLWYQAISTPILVTDDFQVPINGGFPIAEADWSAFVTSVSAKWLHDLFRRYGERLFSANVRGYLGSRNADANINNGIKETAQSDPSHFWVYNNGITILVNDFKENDDKSGINVSGISIVNGAQTAGAVGNLAEPPDASGRILVRFVKSTEPDIVDGIVRYNNSQNKITAPDFRSRDPIQKRLLTEFTSMPSVEYAPRRGGQADAIRRRPNALPSVTAGQALAAFHGSPDVAYNQKTGLWENDKLYSLYFNDNTTARHILFCYSLLRCVEKRKESLLEKSKTNAATQVEKNQLAFFRLRGSTFLMVSAIADSIEVFLGAPVPNRFRLRFRGNLSPENSIIKWDNIVAVGSSFSERLQAGLSDGIKNQTRVKTAIAEFTSLVNATKIPNGEVYGSFADHVEQQ